MNYIHFKRKQNKTKLVIVSLFLCVFYTDVAICNQCKTSWWRQYVWWNGQGPELGDGRRHIGSIALKSTVFANILSMTMYLRIDIMIKSEDIQTILCCNLWKTSVIISCRTFSMHATQDVNCVLDWIPGRGDTLRNLAVLVGLYLLSYQLVLTHTNNSSKIMHFLMHPS